MGQSVRDVNAMSLHEYAALGRGWRILHATEKDFAEITGDEAADLAAWLDSADFHEG